MLLDFMLEEIGPGVYITDGLRAQASTQLRVGGHEGGEPM